MASGFTTQPALPSDLEAEQAVLGCILMNSDVLANVMEKLSVKDFFDNRNQMIYNAMLDLEANNQHIDNTTINAYLQSHNQKGYVTDQYIANLTVSAPSIEDVSDYVGIVKNRSVLRQIVRIGTDLQSEGSVHKEEPKQILNNAQSELLKISSDNSSSGLEPMSQIVSDALTHFRKIKENQNGITGLPTGFTDIDQLTTGLHKGELMVVAARPAMGKTTFAVNVAQRVAQNTQVKDNTVAIFSLEMSSVSLANRMICAQSHINAQHWRTGHLSTQETANAFNAADQLSKAHIYIDDTPGINITTLMARARRLSKRVKNLGLIVVDYLQLVDGNNKESRQQEVSEVSKSLKNLARDLQVPVIALSQLSRSVEQREDKRPKLSDIRESGSIEQDADIVAFLYRPDYYKHNSGNNSKKNSKESFDQQRRAQAQDDAKGSPSITDFIIDKNRSGPNGTVHLVFLKARNEFQNIAKQANEALMEYKQHVQENPK